MGDDMMDEENVSFSGSEDEFQALEEPTNEKSKKKDLKRKADVPSKGVGKTATKSKKTKTDDDQDEDDDDDLDEFDFIEKASAQAQKGSSKKTTKGGNKLSDLFADAEEFSHLLEGNISAGKGGRGFDMLGSGALSNKDKASVKQLEWESGRDKWVRGEDWRKKGKNTKVGNKTKAFKKNGTKK